MFNTRVALFIRLTGLIAVLATQPGFASLALSSASTNGRPLQTVTLRKTGVAPKKLTIQKQAPYKKVVEVRKNKALPIVPQTPGVTTTMQPADIGADPIQPTLTPPEP